MSADKPAPLPAFSLIALDALTKAENMAFDHFSKCVDEFGEFNVEKAVLTGRTISMSAFLLIDAEYQQLPGHCSAWRIEIERLLIQAILRALPPSGAGCRDYLGGQLQWNLKNDVAVYSQAELLKRGVNKPEPSVTDSSTRKSLRIRLEPRPELLEGRDTINRSQAALALGVSVRQLDRYIEDKLLIPTGGFGRKRFSTKDLRRFLTRKSKDN